MQAMPMTLNVRSGELTRIEDRFEQFSSDDDRDGCENDPNNETEVPVLKITPPDRVDGTHGKAAHIRPEIAHHGRECRDLHGGGKRRPGILPAEKSRDDPHMRGR